MAERAAMRSSSPNKKGLAIYEGRKASQKSNPTRPQSGVGRSSAAPKKAVPKGGRPLPVKRKTRGSSGAAAGAAYRKAHKPAAKPTPRGKQGNPVSDALNAVGRGAVGAQNFLKDVPNSLAQGILQGRKSPLQKVLEGQPTSKRKTTSRRA